MVIPCYNKEKYIATTFDTILNQTWDNIELVLVNDGSTDGTRDIIAAYEQRFKERGYTVLIIDQKNAGVCAAAKTGLERATGDYLCMVDADDELDPTYVSALAGWLDKHPSCDLTFCRGINFKDTNGGREFWHYPSEALPKDDNEIGPEHFLMGEIIRQTVWIYMVRATYLERCKIVENYFTNTRGSHEPSYVIPLLAYDGQRKYIPEVLYNFNGSGEGLSQSQDMGHARGYYDEYVRLCNIATDALPDAVADSRRKLFLQRAALLSASLRLYRIAVNMKAEDSVLESYAAKLLNDVNSAFNISPPLQREDIVGRELRLTNVISNCMFGRMSAKDAEDFPGMEIEGLLRPEL
jgi:glycosyltransferase involved in cell wall biosynthesis